MIRVLLADDHHLLRTSLARILGDQPDIEIVGQASNGASAVKLAHRVHPDVILMDYQMPLLSGVQATRILVEQLPRARVIGLTLHDDSDIHNRMVSAGARVSLSKACGAAILLEAIRKVCGGRRGMGKRSP